MKTITVNDRTKAGKTLLELTKILTETGSKGITTEIGLSKPNGKEKSSKQKSINRLSKEVNSVLSKKLLAKHGIKI